MDKVVVVEKKVPVVFTIRKNAAIIMYTQPWLALTFAEIVELNLNYTKNKNLKCFNHPE